MIASWLGNGDSSRGIFFRDQARALSEIGCEVDLVGLDLTSIRSFSERERFFPGLVLDRLSTPTVRVWRIVGVNVFAGRSNIMSSLRVLFYVLIIRHFFKTAILPEMVYAQSIFEASFVACALKKKYQVPYIIVEHATAFQRGLVNPAQINRSRQIVLDADQIFAVSPYLANTLKKLYGGNLPIKVLSNFVDNRFFQDTKKRDDKKKSPTYLCVGELVPKKNVDSIIEAFGLVKRDLPSAKLFVVGDGPLKSSLQTLVEMRQLHDVKFFGAVSRNDLVKILKDVDIFVSASRSETFGIVVAEAIAFGLPVIASRSGGPEWIIEGLDGCQIVDEPSPQILAVAMNDVWVKRSELSIVQLQNRAKQRFSEESFLRQMSVVLNR